MLDKIKHPVVNCIKDGQRGERCPVVIEDFNADGEASPDSDSVFTAIYCPGCSLVLNMAADVEVEWYTEDELEEATGWKVAGITDA